MIERCSSSFSLSTSKIRQINISQNTLFRLRKTLCAVFWHMCQNPVSFNFFPIILTLVAEAVLLHFLDFNHSSYHRLILESESECCSVMSNSLQPHGLYSPWNSPGQNTGVGSLSFLQGIFPTQGSNPVPQHCRQILYQSMSLLKFGAERWVEHWLVQSVQCCI